MRKIVIGVVILMLIGTGGYALFGRAATQTPQGTTPTSAALEMDDQLVAEARVVPAHSAELRFPISGTVAEVLIQEGDLVAKDAILARLDTRELELRVSEAEGAVAQAKAGYARLLAGATPEEIAAAQARLAQAQARQRQAQGDVTQQDITAARAQLEQTRAALAQLRAGAKDVDVQSAQAALDQAGANLQTQRDSLSAAKTRAQSQSEQAANALRDHQADYDRIYWDNRKLEGELARWGQELPRENVDREAAALRAVQSAGQDLAQAQLAYQQARQAEVSGIQAAEAQLRDAQASFERLRAPADRDKLAAARAQIAQAEANLARLLGDQRAGGLEAAEAEVANAQANLNGLTAAPRQVDLAVVLAQIQQAETTLKQAKLALDQATLTAPFAGTVAELNLKVGEMPNSSRAAILLADLAQWQLETSDLTELSVAAVHIGAPVRLTFDALPGVELTGTVARIKPLGENKQGDITYSVVIVPGQQDERLRWNMTAAVAISPP